MSNFWAEKLGTNRPGNPAPQQYVPSSRPWWDERPLPPAQPPQAPQQYQQMPQQEAEYAPRQARSARQKQRCPECDSANYMAVAAEGVSSSLTGPARAHCWDCGYPYVQSGSGGLGHSSKDAKATPSRQIHDGSSQVIPGFITHIQ